MSEVAFSARGTALLRELAENNEREWFTAHKPEIEAHVLGPANDLLAALTAEFESVWGEPFQGKVFRIYRDVRFSKDKTPYNPYVRLSLSRIGEDCEHTPAFHFSFEVDHYVVGTGIWAFTADDLTRFRDSISKPETLASLEGVLGPIRSSGGRIPEPELARLPKGLSESTDPVHARRKGITAWRDVPFEGPPRDVSREELRAHVAGLRPLFDWLSRLGG